MTGVLSMFFLFISNTDIARVPGLSVAGANVDVLPYTSPADADVIRFGRPLSIDCFPMDPDGHPTPALITRAAVTTADIPLCVVRAGSALPPAPPYVELCSSPGGDPRVIASVGDVKKIFDCAGSLAGNVTKAVGRVMLAETIPGGTTTALLVLRALGYDCMVSSASNINPISLKESIWRDASGRLGIETGGFKNNPLRAISELGDPMQAAVLGFIIGSEKRTEIVLAGGTQMLAIAACLRAMGNDRKITVATTRYVMDDRTSSFSELARLLDVDTYAAPLDFSGSPHKGLRDYEEGFVKEGVGAGGSVLYASWNGVGADEVVTRTNELYGEITLPYSPK
jgi:uncharacterized protein (TIGR00303 family)